MNTIIKVISLVLFWVIVPLLMFCLIVFGKIIGNKAKDKEKKTSANAGWWAGLILFVFFFIYHLKEVTNPQLRMDANISISIYAGLLGCIIGSVILWFLKSLIQERTVGILTLILSGSGSISIFSYFFIRNINNFLMSTMLGLVFGTLMHIVIFPKSGHNLFSD